MRIRAGVLPLICLCMVAIARSGAAAASDPAPAVPRWVAVRLAETGRVIGLRWNVVPGATAYELFKREGDGDYRLLATVQGIQHLDEALQPGFAYVYRLRALSGASAGPFSEERTVVVPGAAATEELFAPRWRKQRVEMDEHAGRLPSFRVELGWRPVRGAVGYRLWRGTAGGGGLEPIGTFTELDAVDSPVEPGRDYVYVLTAIDAQLRESPRSLDFPVKVRIETAALDPGGETASLPAQLVWEVGNAAVRSASAPHRALLTDPVDVAFDSRRDRVYVSSAHHRHIVVLGGEEGRPAAPIGPRLGKHELVLPLGLGVDGGGNLIVVDQGQAALFVVAPDGTLLRRIPVKVGKTAKPPRLVDAAAHRDGRIFVTDAASRTVLVFSAAGRQLSAWGKAGARPGEFGAVGAIVVVDDGTVAVADAAAGQIKLFTPRENSSERSAHGPPATGGSCSWVGSPACATADSSPRTSARTP